MNDDELKKLWQQQPLRDPDPSVAQLVSAMQKKMTGLRSILNVRDLRELAACAVVTLVFGVFYFTVYRGPISRVGAVIVIGGAFFIAGKLIYTRRSTPPAPPGATTVESLEAELKAVRAQSRLLKSVLWWYLLPGLIGLIVATWGLPIDIFSKISVSLIFVAINAGIWWLNQWARAKQILPAEAELESLVHSAKTGAPLDETHVVSLRPIVISMGASDRVKPVEFKVAFWQLAIFGVPGVVGIWFFLILGLTVNSANVDLAALHNQNGNSNGQAGEEVAQFVPAEANRYFVVARKVIELFNTGDYAALGNLYNPELSQAFPPKQTFEFYTRLAAELGKVKTFDGPTGAGYRGWIGFQLHCQRGELVMSLALDADDKIAGIHIGPAPKPSLSVTSFTIQLFSWQHLLWLPPFFLGGLVYTWLIQKTTERAVGISTLGIHLLKGQNLVLWDDIKEVRPFRFLHIQNLWLITESGEKTIMHWTPLERHPDVKAAVERCAPIIHPIREYLSLLRRT